MTVFDFRMQLDVLDAIPFVVLLANVWRVRSGAGISRSFLQYTCLSSGLYLITSKTAANFLVSSAKFAIVFLLYCSVTFKFPIKSDRFKDSHWTFLILPISLIMSIFSLSDGGIRDFLENFALLMNSMSISCQVSVIKQSRRTTLFIGFFPAFVLCKICSIYLLIKRAFSTEGTEMWCCWISGAIMLLMSIDMLYFSFRVKQRTDEIDLPIGVMNDFE